MIKFDKWSSFDKNRDGVVLQYRTSESSNWKTLGTLSDGINWYESFAILGQPGNQQIGWSGLDNSFVSARHQLSALAGEKEARFRFIYASDGSNRNDNGFAFDNISVSERQHIILMEHFTNTSASQSIKADAILDSIAVQEPLDMVNLKYHTDLFGGDLFSQSIHSVSDVRSIYYGVPSLPYAVLDGGYSAAAKYNYASHSPTSQDIELRSLIDPSFKVSIKTVNNNNGISINATITSLVSLNNKEISIHLAVIRIDTVISNKKMRNILLALLPDPAGVTYNQNWVPGDSKALSASYAVNNIADTSKLLIVAFIQDESTKEVLQAAANRQLVISTGIHTVDITDNNKVGFKVYPNPAKDIVNVVPENLPSASCIIEIYNSLGVLVQMLKQENNSNYYSIDISNYSNGLYILKVINFNNQVFTQKLIINH
jgi:hypothetical protein